MPNTFTVKSRLTGEELPGVFAESSLEELDDACRAAKEAFRSFRQLDRAELLEAIAAGIENLGPALIDRAHHETGLPIPRLEGERGRTCNQLRMFANVLRQGDWLDRVSEDALPDRKPVPRPNLSRHRIGIGPVAVFGASNFPLAFSVAGGDTASALAAGCPVVVKAHPAHPGTCAMVAEVLREVLPEGVFHLLQGGQVVGEALVQNPEIRGVGFTGSLRVGRHLFDLGARRARPIPVFSEMGSVNPVFVLPGATTEAVANAYADSLALGVGQFCTNPGIIVGMGPEFGAFVEKVRARLGAGTRGTMLTEGIERAYVAGLEERSSLLGQEIGAGAGTLFSVNADTFFTEALLAEELFGPAGVAVECASVAEMMQVAEVLEGQLTASLHFGAGEDPEPWLRVLEEIAGRIVLNGFPTGVEVGTAMQHGGPYPAATDSRFTSVGTGAIDRFTRPVCFQS